MFALTVYFFVVILLRAIRSEDNSTELAPMKTNETASTNSTTTEATTIELSAKNATTKEFKPSPHLETFYEYNRTPVVPAMAEAKTNLNAGEVGPQSNSRSFFWPIGDMFDKKPAVSTTTESSWVRRVVFPQATVETTRDRPYAFVTAGNSVLPSFGRPPPRIPVSVADNPRGYGHGPSKWDQFEGGGTKGPMIMHKTQYESYGPPEPTSSGVSAISPVKKIIGLLAALVPIGLLISALTPSVIQVMPVNTT